MDATLPHILPEKIANLAKEVLQAAADRDMQLTAAESCTGGLVSAVLTDVEGLSHVFERGFVTYSEDAKCELLGVDRGLIERHGVVSREVAIAMAQCAMGRSRAGLAISITGFAGPAGDDEEEGLVHFGCVREGGREWHREEHFGAIGRDGVRIAALEVALAMMNNALADG